MLSKTRLLVVLAVTILCLYIVWPTLVYFTRVATLPADATEQERAKVAEMLEEGSMIRLGLDLQGGADFLLAVDTSQLIRRAIDRDTESLRRELQRAGVDATVRADRENQTITLVLKNSADGNLAADVLKGFEGRYDFEGFTLATLSTLTNPAAPGILRMNPEVAASERRQAFEGALKVVAQRVDSLGLTNPIVVRQGEDRIRVQIPGETKPERVKASILRGAALEFRLLHPDHNTLIQDFIKPGSMVPETGSGVIRDEFLEEVISEDSGRPVKVLRKDIPGIPAGYVMRLGVHKEVDKRTGAVTKQVDNIAFLLAERPDLTGENLVRASWHENYQDIRDPIQVTLEFDRNGARIFRDVTTSNVGRRFAILLDDVVYSSPNINEPIPGGRAQISGGFSRAEAQDLAIVLKAGALKAPLRVLEDSAIGPSLGIESIKGATRALIYGFIFLVVFISVAYSVGGLIAIAATTMNVLLLMAMLALMNATLTLSGIGGLLLTMGMAVDANVIIYERLLDELNGGKPPRAAIVGAFDRAAAVILDSNITSLLPALVLVLFEVVSGSVKGFWVSLSIGLLANLYTGLTVTRTLLEAYYDTTGKVSVRAIGPFAALKASLNSFSIDWVAMRTRGLIVSAVLSVAVIAVLASGRIRLGVDFTGGLLAQVAFPGGTQAQLHDSLGQGFADVQIVKVLNTDNFLVTVPASKGAGTDLDRLRSEFQDALTKGLGDKATIKSISSVEPQISREFFLNALVMVAITSLIVGAYLAFRFQWIFGVAAAIALIHDVLLTLGINVLLGKALTMDVVSALLVILGYSVNDTIVVFDRIREEMNEHPGMTLKEIVNRGINLTMGRTLFTGVTVLSTLCALWFFGGAALSDFSFTLVVGILFGTYSSWFVAAAIAYNLLSKRQKDDPGAARPQKAVTAQARLVTTGAVR